MSPNVLSGELVLLLVTASTFLVGIVAGLFFAFSVSVVLALDTLSASAYAETMRSINEAILNVVFGVAFFGSIVLPVVSTAIVILRGDWTAQYGQLFLAGTAVYLAGTIAVTVTVHIPMNDYVETWSPASPPDDWAAIRERWALWNHVRTIAAVIAFASYLAAVVALVVELPIS